MAEEQPTESTSLLSGVTPQYVFDSRIAREKKRRTRQFQCCLCTIFLSIFLVALIITLSYTINLPVPENNTSVPQSNTSLIAPLETNLMLFANTWPLNDTAINSITWNSTDEWTEAVNYGKKSLKEKDKIEQFVPSLPLNSPSYRHQKVVATSDRGRTLSNMGYEQEYTTTYLFRNRSDRTDRSNIPKICMFNNTHTPSYCHIQIECNIFQKYRTLDGTCNNLQHPNVFGVAYTPFRRVLPSDYLDGISKPRMAKNGKQLPSARTVSIEVHRPLYREDVKFSVMLAVWGQFLDHDITATASSVKSNGSSVSCCSNAMQSPECFPVILDPIDPLYNLTNCIEFMRSAPSPKCCLGPREQMNQATAYIDGSVIYGVEKNKSMMLRSFKGGLLKMYVTEDNRTLLPLSEDLNDGCNRQDEKVKGRYCFMAGDGRANENLHLTSMQLIWARHHNLLASNLSKLNPHWDDERIFQEVRKIVGAQMQHITYNEFLGIILGHDIMQKYDLYPQKYDYFRKYDQTIDPTIANNFATAAFRFAHTLIPGVMKFVSNDSSSPEFIQMRKMLFDPFILYDPGKLDKTLRGAANTSLEASDTFFTDELKSHLFERENEVRVQPKFHGLDLVALNIQRGRDHGLPGYIHWREHCGLSKPQSFKDLQPILHKEPLETITAIYNDIEDIDLYTGAVSEKTLYGSLVGPTLTCLILDQFIRIKYGDRFWYENPQTFPGEQLREIKKTSLAGIICDNSDNLEYVQPLVMEQIRKGNDNVPCSKMTKPDLIHWKENLDYVHMGNNYINAVPGKSV